MYLPGLGGGSKIAIEEGKLALGIVQLVLGVDGDKVRHAPVEREIAAAALVFDGLLQELGVVGDVRAAAVRIDVVITGASVPFVVQNGVSDQNALKKSAYRGRYDHISL